MEDGGQDTGNKYHILFSLSARGPGGSGVVRRRVQSQLVTKVNGD